jgi:hypothetical protein
LGSISHEPGATLKVEGEFSTTFKLDWQPVTEQARRCWNDEEYTTEQAAYGIAFLLILQLTKFTVIEHSRKGTGFDYWLGIQDAFNTLPFQRMARLEVSGIRKGNRAQINSRVKQKTEQTRVSDVQGLPAYIYHCGRVQPTDFCYQRQVYSRRNHIPMSQIQVLHQQAMDLAEAAAVAV